MSQSQQAPVAPTVTPAVAPAPPPSGQHAGVQPARTSDTVRLLNLHRLGLVVACVVFGLVGVFAFGSQASSVGDAQDSTAQLIRVQDIQTSLLSADATATNAFLVGGLEPPEQRATYDAALESVGSLIADAADAEPRDRAALAKLNQLVIGYAATVEQARANNRQGLPVGSQYLRNASADLRAEALPILDNLVDANSARASDGMDNGAMFVVVLVGLIVLGGMLYSHRWVARRFKRRFNVGLVAAIGLVGLATLVGFIMLARVATNIDDIEANSFSVVNAAAQARIAAYDAKSNESLTLIARGSGGAFEDAWVASDGIVDDSLRDVGDDNLSDLWSGYVQVHKDIRAADDGGDWDQAVQIATGDDPTASSNGSFGAFDDAAEVRLDSASDDASNGLDDQGSSLGWGIILILLAGLVAAVLARLGLGQRLKEYR